MTANAEIHSRCALEPPLCNVRHLYAILMMTVGCRYERSRQAVQFGRSLVQRHVALPEDLANEAGEGLLVSTSGRGT